MSNSAVAVSSSSSSSKAAVATRRLHQTATHLSKGPERVYQTLMKESNAQATDPNASVLFTESTCTRSYHLNRPKQLNALNLEMVESITNRVDDWSSSRISKVLVGHGKGGKAFCAGGDIKHIAKLVASTNPTDKWQAMKFFKEEFELDWKLACFSVGSQAWDGSKAYVAIMDGLTMGGGAGLSYGAVIRVATENTQFAMPETLIGYTPDVGATHYLSLLDGKIGRYLALTGETITGRACYDLGLATHYVGSHNIPSLIERLDAVEDIDTNGGVDGLVSIVEDFELRIHERIPKGSVPGLDVGGWKRGDPNSGTRLVGDIRVALDDAFAQDTVPEIIERLQTYIKKDADDASVFQAERQVSDWAKETVEVLGERSPVSLMVTLVGMQNAEEEIKSVAKELAREVDRYHKVPPNEALRLAFEREYKTVESFVYESSPDFPKGVIKKLVEKLSPEWDREVDPATLQSNFFPKPKAPFKNANTSPLELAPPTHGFDKHHFRSYGLPSEVEVRAIVKGEVEGDFQPRTSSKSRAGGSKSSGDLALNRHMVLEWFNKDRLGVKDRVTEILNRKTYKVGEGEWLAWSD
ncbi:Enoyl-CoA hydratase [Phaffia rhodozyma]|uniref:3-hydroxyisobutyryl-CoA hydrolase n=1 Tax=Phaffia rhodozyma TaxID=264483 RepID=A0A0F7SUR0_PHARH|nr:Enoyl-CoA hydratase [Phaffia rhodozyma]